MRHLPDGPVPIHKGLCHWSRPGWAYACTQDPANPLGVTAIHFDLLDAAGNLIPPDADHLPPEQLQVREPALTESITTWIAEMAMDHRAGSPLVPALDQAANAMLYGLLVKLAHHTTAPRLQGFRESTAWNRLLAYIHTHLHELEPVDDLARKAGYTRSHFSRIFKARTGICPQQYIGNARIALAKELLRTTELPIGDIALRAGYAEVYPFSRQFKRLTGIAPSHYRTRTTAYPP